MKSSSQRRLAGPSIPSGKSRPDYRSGEKKRPFDPNSAECEKNRSYRFAPDGAYTDTPEADERHSDVQADGTGPIRDAPCKIRSCYRIRPFR